MSEITPFEIEIAEDVISDLKDRLSRTRWPDKETVDDWTQGVPLAYQKKLMDYSMSIINQREKEILIARRLSENVSTLEDLSKKYKVSRERIRQIETKAFEKLQKTMLNSAKSSHLLPRN